MIISDAHTFTNVPVPLNESLEHRLESTRRDTVPVDQDLDLEFDELEKSQTNSSKNSKGKSKSSSNKSSDDPIITRPQQRSPFERRGTKPKRNSSRSLTASMHRKTLEYFDFTLEFKVKAVESLYVRFNSLAHSFQSCVILTALPYLLFILSVLSMTFSYSRIYVEWFTIVCASTQIFVLITLVAYTRSVWLIHIHYASIISSKMSRKQGSREDDHSGERTMVSNPYYEKSLYADVVKHKDKRKVDYEKSISVSRLAGLLELSLVVMLSVWILSSVSIEECPDFCYNNIPIIGLLFLWMVPLHFSLTTCIRWLYTAVFELISKLIIVVAVVNTDAKSTNSILMQLIFVSLFWVGLWCPLLYYVSRKPLNDYRSSEAYMRVIDKYYSDRDKNKATVFTSGMIWEAVEEPPSAEESSPPWYFGESSDERDV